MALVAHHEIIAPIVAAPPIGRAENDTRTRCDVSIKSDNLATRHDFEGELRSLAIA